MIDRVCEACGKRFGTYKSVIEKGRGRFCSQACSNRTSGALRARSIEERFWEKVNKTDGCWLWIGAKTRDGYGQIKRYQNLSNFRAHRLSWEIHNGPIPDGLDVLHNCDNPPCVRPDHLWLGTDADNMRDRDEKGRCRASGFPGQNAKLTEANVLDIRARYSFHKITCRMLALEYGVSAATVWHAVAGDSWKHLPGVSV